MRAALFPLILLATPAIADPADEAATAAFVATYRDACFSAFDEQGQLIEPPTRHEAQSTTSYDGSKTPITLWEFSCMMGAYNLSSVVYARSDLTGLVPMTFATPDLTIITEDPADPESAVKEVKIAGWSASPFVTNASFDPLTGEMSEYSKWRGIGDASSASVWRLVDEKFRLIRHEVDATYDGELNPQTLVQFD
ncbi:hypothetical protein GCM10011452_31250 [Gemmobacter lanyuensis]|uniref:DUF1176 domain-containing protein n=1 Tax=Gemmobacter lanyuensis TaxID=1054497 RepID=A0A918J1B2_9RHOB|nr:DUF1176 domain-containing protein [Gemmobacter lanyuensis]GGW40580.1 hypothetical protein GCM10011452_31250 [Gemmobacter lanyuensis]